MAGTTDDNSGKVGFPDQQHATTEESCDVLHTDEFENVDTHSEVDEVETVRRSSRERKEPKRYGEWVIWPSSKGGQK